MNFTPQAKKNMEDKAKRLIQSKKETITDLALEIMESTKNYSEEEKALFTVIYSGLKWENGYDQGKHDPDFEKSEDSEDL